MRLTFLSDGDSLVFLTMAHEDHVLRRSAEIEDEVGLGLGLGVVWEEGEVVVRLLRVVSLVGEKRLVRRMKELLCRRCEKWWSEIGDVFNASFRSGWDCWSCWCEIEACPWGVEREG
jgi:hypothetical protein